MGCESVILYAFYAVKAHDAKRQHMCESQQWIFLLLRISWFGP